MSNRVPLCLEDSHKSYRIAKISFMPMFQKNIVEKYLKNLPGDVAERYARFRKNFLDVARQKNIRESKEEAYQEGFLRELFVDCLGYAINPTPGFNLKTEWKNETDSRKADGAILIDGKAVGIIELKDHKTRDLRTVEAQAFGYKNNHPGARYVVISNFERLRFYIDYTAEYEEFDLFHLTEEGFRKLYLILAYENILAGIPLKIKEESRSEEKSITEKLYRDYSTFKRELFHDILKRNGNVADKLVLFRKTQKLLDRLLFIFFAEDRGLIPVNMTLRIIDDVHQLRDLLMGVSLYERFQTYFHWIDVGHRGKDFEISAYNGGLFKPDELLDSLEIDDDLLERHTKILSAYDFESDVSVDILGHIFEHSLSEIEEIQNELNGVAEKKTLKRKKDGVFYTPAYITKYIVENTIGALCENKKRELGIDWDEDAFRFREKALRLDARKRWIEKFDAYRRWLLDLSIVDPACGSGAFLNAAVQFLKEEHGKIDAAKATLFENGSDVQMAFSDVESSILEKNIYGVDINDESVEIAKLSLWLHTARPGRKLSNLNDNVKCGNSLIDDANVSPEKAFDWKKEFPEVFAKGGFDVVIGNPPYLRVQGLRENYERETRFYEKNYCSATERFDIYALFMERGFSLLNKNGMLSFILPHKFMNASFGIGIRKFIYDKKALNRLVHFGEYQVFDEASVYTCIITLSAQNDTFGFVKANPLDIQKEMVFEKHSIKELSDAKKWNLTGKKESSVLEAMGRQKQKVKDLFKGVFQGIVSGDNKAFYLYHCRENAGEVKGFSQALNQYVSIEKEVCRRIYTGKTIVRYALKNREEYIVYPYRLCERKTTFFSEEEMKEKFPHCYDYFCAIRNRLEARGSESMKYPVWYALWNARNIENFGSCKILTPDVCFGGSMVYDCEGNFYNDTSYGLILKEPSEIKYKAYLAILNSSLTWYFLSKTGTGLRGGFFRFKTKYLEPMPLPEMTEENLQVLSFLADTMLVQNKSLQEKRSRFLRRVSENFESIKMTVALEKFDELDFKKFLAELKKQKIKLSLNEQDEWEGYFDRYKSECHEISEVIARTDREINQKVYSLYGLTAEEIAIVERAE